MQLLNNKPIIYCARCKKLVEKVRSVWNDPVRSMTYCTIECHGESEQIDIPDYQLHDTRYDRRLDTQIGGVAFADDCDGDIFSVASVISDALQNKKQTIN